MSYCGALPSAESESHLLVDACLARVRRDAGLDDDPVLPPLHVLIGKSKDLPPRQRLVVSASAHNLPSAAAIVKAAAAAAAASMPACDRARIETTLTPQGRAKKTFAQRLRWPVFLCGFLAGTFGGIAVMKSPVGHKPAVQSFMKSVRHQAAATYATAASKTHLHR